VIIRLQEQRHRVEKVLAVARVFLASASLLAVRLDATQPATYFTLTDILLLGYLAYGVLVMLWLRAGAQFRYPKIPLLLHTIDILGSAIIALFSDGSPPLLVLLVFVLVAAGYRWGLRETVATAAVVILVVVSGAITLSYGSKHLRIVQQGQHELNRLVIRIAYLLGMGFLIGLLAEREKRLQEESSTIACLLAKVRPERGIKQSLQAVLADLLHIFTADAVLLAVEEVRWQRLYIWEGRSGADPQELKLRLFEADPSQEPIYRFPLAGEFVHALRRQNRAGSSLVSVLALDADGKPAKGTSCVFPDHPLWRDVESVVAGSFTFSEEWSGRIFLINSKLGRSQLAELRYLQTLVLLLRPAVSGAYMLRRLRSKAGTMERMRVARELHDGAIQSLLATQMAVDVLRRRAANSSKGLGAELCDPCSASLAKIQEALHQEIINLRELMLETKLLNLDPRQFVEFLADLVERFRRETGIRMHFVTDLEEVRLPAHVLRELGRIVQEALVNARKHSRARNILVSLGYKDARCRIVIDDDGRGFDFAGCFSLKDLEAERNGPMVIKERVRSIGGELTIESVPGRGARLEISIPSPKVQATYA
jgi:signal transduction histidine kinase